MFPSDYTYMYVIYIYLFIQFFAKKTRKHFLIFLDKIYILSTY